MRGGNQTSSKCPATASQPSHMAEAAARNCNTRACKTQAGTMSEYRGLSSNLAITVGRVRLWDAAGLIRKCVQQTNGAVILLAVRERGPCNYTAPFALLIANRLGQFSPRGCSAVFQEEH